MSQNQVAVVDYAIGNLFSVLQACRHVGLDAKVVTTAQEIADSSALILPGVGAFSLGMEHLKAKKLDTAILSHIKKGNPFFGICLGMQLLFDSSTEFGAAKGLGVISGEVLNLKDVVPDLPVPKITWDHLEKGERDWKVSPLQSLSSQDDFYFVHSFYCSPSHVGDALAFSSYGSLKYCSAVQKENVFAVQFHPERSGEKGLQIYRSWKELNF
jgi:glutamine amidotransferase